MNAEETRRIVRATVQETLVSLGIDITDHESVDKWQRDRALGVKSADLMPAGVPSASGEAAPFEVRGMADGRLYLRIARTVSSETGMKILALLAEEDRQS